MSTESLAEDLESAKQRVLDLIDERDRMKDEDRFAFWQEQHFDNLLHHAEQEVVALEGALAERGVEAPAVVPVITEATPVVVTQAAEGGDIE